LAFNVENEKGELWASSVSQPPTIILRLLVVMSIEDCLSAIKFYQQQLARGIEPELRFLKGAVISLYHKLKPSFNIYKLDQEKDFNIKEYERLLYKASDYETILKYFDDLNNFTYLKKVTQWDSKDNIDTIDTEVLNKIHGWGGVD